MWNRLGPDMLSPHLLSNQKDRSLNGRTTTPLHRCAVGVSECACVRRHAGAYVGRHCAVFAEKEPAAAAFRTQDLLSGVMR
jgi:hypothetical protein